MRRRRTPRPLRVRRRFAAAYRATCYRVAIDGIDVDLRVGTRSAAVDVLLVIAGARCWAYLTAVNPASRLLPAADNAARQCALEAWLRRAGYRCLTGEAIADTGGWPMEPGVLALGLARAKARRLAVRYGQNALLWGQLGAPATLVWAIG